MGWTEKWLRVDFKLETSRFNSQSFYELLYIQCVSERGLRWRMTDSRRQRERARSSYSKSGLTEWPLITPDRKGYMNARENRCICHLPASYKWCVCTFACVCASFIHQESLNNKILSVQITLFIFLYFSFFVNWRIQRIFSVVLPINNGRSVV